MSDTEVAESGGSATATVTAGNFGDDIRAVGDRIAGLTLKQAIDLQNYLKDAYGIEAAQAGVLTQPPPTDKPEPDVEVQTAFDVVLVGLADPLKKLSVVKEVRSVTGQGLAEAKATVEGAPKTIKEGQPKAEAERLKKQLEDAGGKVELK